MLIGWTLGFAVVGAALGSVAHGIADLLNSSPRLRLLIATLGGQGGVVDAYFAAIFAILGLVVSGYAIQATLRLRSEEEEARAEPVLATSVSRLSWASSHLVFAALGPAIALAGAGVAAGVVHGERDDVPRLLAAAMVQLPAVWVSSASPRAVRPRPAFRASELGRARGMRRARPAWPGSCNSRPGR